MYPFLLALVSAALFGLSIPLSKTLLSQWAPQQLAGILYLGAALGAAIPLAMTRQGLYPNKFRRADAIRLSVAVLSGGILGPLFLLAGLKASHASSVSLWLNLEMVATSLLGVFFFGDHLGSKGWIGAAAVVGAGVLLTWGEGLSGLKAGGFLALACICWGIDNNMTALIDGLPPLQSTFWKGFIAGMVNLGIGLLLEPAPNNFIARAIPALAVGMFSYGVSITLYISAAQKLGAVRSQMIFASAPLFAFLVSWIFLRDTLTLPAVLALGMQSAGMLLLFRDKHSHAHSHEPVEHAHEHGHDDGHHMHEHKGHPATFRHSHLHTHQAMSHSHPHWPDLHHRHGHS